jgi:hypothetical protein
VCLTVTINLDLKFNCACVDGIISVHNLAVYNFYFIKNEKHEIQLLLQQYLREERRDDMYDNFKSAQVEQHQGELKFSSNINELRQLIEE